MSARPSTVSAAVAAVLIACGAPDTTAPASFIAQFQPVATATTPGAHLTGDGEVPPTGSAGVGQAVFQLSKDGSEVSYRLNIANIENTIMAHIHLAAAGVIGPVVVWLRPTAPPPPEAVPGRFDGVYATGTFSAANLVGPLAGQPLSALIDAMKAGDTYVNVHTSQFTGGEIRGQIRVR